MNGPARHRDRSKSASGVRHKRLVDIFLGIFARYVVDRDRFESLAVIEVHGAEFGAADAHRVFEDFLEQRRELLERAADSAQHLRRRGLLFQRFKKVPGASMKVLGRADILYGGV